MNPNKINQNDFYINSKRYILSKDNNNYIFNIYKSQHQLLIKCQKYELLLNHHELKILTKSVIDSIDKAYTYISSLFEDKTVKIIKIKEKKNITLMLSIIVYNKETKIKFVLDYNEKNKDKITCNNIQENKNEQNILTNYQEHNKNIENEKNICKTYEKINDSFAYDNLDNTFIIFKSINNQLYLIYATENKSIIIFDIIRNQKINEIKNAHNTYITNFRHYRDNSNENNNRDLFMSISGNDNNLKIWDLKNLDCILNIENINNTGALDSACIFNKNKKNYIITSNDTENDTSEDKDADIEPESIKIYDFNGNKINELNDSKYRTFFIDTYEDALKTYIITGNEGFVQAYDYENNEKYFKYWDPTNNNRAVYGHCSIIINTDKYMTRLFETSWDGNIRIWNFHQGDLINKIEIGCLQGICLSSNNKYLYVGCDNYIKIINLENGIIRSLKVHEKEDTNETYDTDESDDNEDNDDNGNDDKEILTLKKIIHPKYGEMLLSQSSGEYEIKFWLIDNILNA